MSVLRIERVVANGDTALTLCFSEGPQRLAGIHALCSTLYQQPLPQMINVIPTVADITLVFTTEIKDPNHLIQQVEPMIRSLNVSKQQAKTHDIPVCYHPDLAVDLPDVCQRLSLNAEQLIRQHSEPTYQVGMLGFLPGFAYLDGNAKTLQLPRKSTPSLQVAAGSVAIAGGQTGIYSLASPGGWHVIGRTPVKMIDWNQTTPTLLQPMDWVNFKPISLSEYHHLTQNMTTGKNR